jgi:hypothetical protein
MPRKKPVKKPIEKVEEQPREKAAFVAPVRELPPLRNPVAPRSQPLPIDPASLRRNKPQPADPQPESPAAANALRASIVELAFNPTREKIREVTIVDRMQGRLLPLLDLEAQGWEYIIEIATYRQDSGLYAKLYGKPKPAQINSINEYTYRLAQWQKSVAGKNLERATDIALAETENKGDDEGDEGGRPDPWAKE